MVHFKLFFLYFIIVFLLMTYKNICKSKNLMNISLEPITLIRVGFLGVRFAVGGGGGGRGGWRSKITRCLILVRIMLETSNLARKYTSICSFRKYTFYFLGRLNFADVGIFLRKLSIFCPKKSSYSKQ